MSNVNWSSLKYSTYFSPMKPGEKNIYLLQVLPESSQPHSLRSNLFASLVILRNISFSFKIRFEEHFSFSRSVGLIRPGFS